MQSILCGEERFVQSEQSPTGSLLCNLPPSCHHAGEPHLCHFGACPPCRQKCGKELAGCPHVCPEVCHEAVTPTVIDVPFSEKPLWGMPSSEVAVVAMPCPPCIARGPGFCPTQFENASVFKNPGGFLLQICKKRKFMPAYDFMGFEGPAHRPVFHFSVTAGGFRAEGRGFNKKEAKADAAAALLLTSGRLLEQATEVDESYAIHHGRFASQNVREVEARDDRLTNSAEFDPDVTLTPPQVSPSESDSAMDMAPVDEEDDTSSMFSSL